MGARGCISRMEALSNRENKRRPQQFLLDGVGWDGEGEGNGGGRGITRMG